MSTNTEYETGQEIRLKACHKNEGTTAGYPSATSYIYILCPLLGTRLDMLLRYTCESNKIIQCFTMSLFPFETSIIIVHSTDCIVLMLKNYPYSFPSQN